jgi:hypothetical protein
MKLFSMCDRFHSGLRKILIPDMLAGCEAPVDKFLQFHQGNCYFLYLHGVVDCSTLLLCGRKASVWQAPFRRAEAALDGDLIPIGGGTVDGLPC